MTKPIQERLFKSRLTITYRTNITGTPQQEKLPYRLLVLGELSGRAERQAGLLPELSKRSVCSIKRGTTVNDHLSEIVPTWRIPAALSELRSDLPGKVVFDKVTCAVPVSALEPAPAPAAPADPSAPAATPAAPVEKKFALGGTAKFTSDPSQNGLCVLDGVLKVSGTLVATVDDKGTLVPKSATVHLVGRVAGTQIDRATAKPIRQITGLVDLSVPVDEKALATRPRDEDDPSAVAGGKIKEFAVQVSGDHTLPAERTIAFTSMDGFTPDEVAASIPEVHRLRVIKQLLVDLQAGMRNRPDVRKRLKDMLPAYGEAEAAAKDKLGAVGELKAWAAESFPLLAVEHAGGDK